MADNRFAPGPRYHMLSVELDRAALDRVTAEARAIPGGLSRVVPPALNQGVKETKTVAYREFLLRLNIARKASVKERIALSPKAGRASWMAGLRISLRRFTLTSFKGTRWFKRQGVRWFPGPGREEIVPRAFIRTVNGTRLAFRRATLEGDRLVPRYPLIPLRGPSLGYVFARDRVLQRQIESQGEKIVLKKLASQVDRLLAGR